MSRRILVLYCLLITVLPITDLIWAQQPKIPRIGYLTGTGSAPPQAFVQGLRDLGYAEGKNIAIEYRSTASRRDRVPGLAAELVRGR